MNSRSLLAMKYSVIAVFTTLIVPIGAAPVEVNGIAAVVNGTSITVEEVRVKAWPQVQPILANRQEKQEGSELSTLLLGVLESALNEMILSNLIADHIKNLPPQQQIQWKRDFANLPREKRKETVRQLELDGNVRRFDARFEHLISAILDN